MMANNESLFHHRKTPARGRIQLTHSAELYRLGCVNGMADVKKRNASSARKQTHNIILFLNGDERRRCCFIIIIVALPIIGLAEDFVVAGNK